MATINVIKRLNTGLIGLVVFITAPVLASESDGNPFTGDGFVNQDWQVVCDNTLTCRAAGYKDKFESYEMGRTASLLITLTAGNKTPLATLKLGDYYDQEEVKLGDEYLKSQGNQVELWFNDMFLGFVQLSKYWQGFLSEKQIWQLIKHARVDSDITLISGDYQWKISTKGMFAVLLKLDEVQGRVGTPLALVSKNNPNRQSLKMPVPTPVIIAGYAYPLSDMLNDNEIRSFQTVSNEEINLWQTNMSRWILPTLSDDLYGCAGIETDFPHVKNLPSWSFYPLDSKHTVASITCSMNSNGEYGAGYWLIENTAPHLPMLINKSGKSYDTGEVWSNVAIDGSKDCWHTRTDVWDGHSFVTTEASTNGLCRGVQLGGAWVLPTVVSEVRK